MGVSEEYSHLLSTSKRTVSLLGFHYVGSCSMPLSSGEEAETKQTAKAQVLALSGFGPQAGSVSVSQFPSLEGAFKKS